MSIRQSAKKFLWSLSLGLVSLVPAMAKDVTPFITITNTDMATAGVGGLWGGVPGYLQLTNTVTTSRTVTNAYLYWWVGHLPGDTYPNEASLLVNGISVTGTNIGIGGADNHLVLGGTVLLDKSQVFRANVKDLVQLTGGGRYTLSNFSVRPEYTSGASLIVFYDDGIPGNNRDFIIYDGNDANGGNVPGDSDGWNASFVGIPFTPGAGATARMQLHVADAQTFADPGITLTGLGPIPIQLAQIESHTFDGVPNGGSLVEDLGDGSPPLVTLIPPSPYVLCQNNNPLGTGFGRIGVGPFGDGALWDIVDFNMTTNFHSGLNNFGLNSDLVAGGADYLSLVVAIFDLPNGSVSGAGGGGVDHSCDTNRPPLVNCFDGVTVEQTIGGPYPIAHISTRVSDPDGDALSVTMTVRGTTRTGLPVDISRFRAVDNGTLVTTVTFDEQLQPGSYVVIYSAVDKCGRATACQTSVTVLDGQNPTIDCGPQIVLIADTLSGTANVPDVLGGADPINGKSVQNSTGPGVRGTLGLVWAKDNSVPPLTLTLTQNPPPGQPLTVGTYQINVNAMDEALNQANCARSLVIVSNKPPIVNPGPNQTIVLPSGSSSVAVTSVATVSDPELELLHVVVTLNGTPISSQDLPSGSTVPYAATLSPGTYTLVVWATDPHHGTASGTTTITVLPTSSVLTVDCGQGAGLMWPPNHRMVNIGLNPIVPAGTIVSIKVYSDEPDQWTQGEANAGKNGAKDDGDDNAHIVGGGNGDFCPDAAFLTPGNVQLRCERSGIQDGRVYLIVINATNPITGATGSCTTSWGIPHDMSAESIASINAQRVAAVAYFTANKAAPAGFVEVGANCADGSKEHPITGVDNNKVWWKFISSNGNKVRWSDDFGQTWDK